MEYVYYAIDYTSQEMYHHGILGQKWGVRRYQNEDGSWTDAGLKRRKRLNSALAVAGGVGAAVGVTLGTGNSLAGRIAGGLTAGTIKRSLDTRAENKRNNINKTQKDSNTLNDYYNSEKGKQELRNYSKKNTVEKTKIEKDKAYNELLNRINESMDTTDDSNMKDTLTWIADSDKPKVIADKLIKANKNLNEYIDPDCAVFQRMPEEAMEGYSRGYLSKKQFDNIYDKTVIDDLNDYGLSDLNGTADMYKDALYVPINENENRFTSWFGNGPENPELVTHYFYSSDSIYL